MGVPHVYRELVMSRIAALSLVLAAFLWGGCAMERYHYPITQDKVPAEAVVAFSEKFPNHVIKSISEQKMLDGKVQYTFISTNPKTNGDSTTFITADGKLVARRM